MTSMTATAGLRVRGLSAGYQGKMVLRDLTLPAMLPGQLTALIGPNGAGKSTLLKTLAGLVACSGDVALDGIPLSGMKPAEYAARIGYMPQRLPDDLDMTVLESLLSILQVCLPAAARAGSGASFTQDATAAPVATATAVPDAAMAIALATLDRLGISPLALRSLASLSGGQRQMASLAQAMVAGPSTLLLDEPTSALDLRYQVAVMRTLQGLARQGHVVVVVLHDLSLAARWADGIVVLKGGAVVASGAPELALTPLVLASAYGVTARVERCSRGFLTVHTDDALDVAVAT